MAHNGSPTNSPNSAPKRPKGILKNTGSFQQSPPDPRISPTSEQPDLSNGDAVAESSARPPMPGREMSEKEITQMNTEINAGGHRRTSSNPRTSISRRQSSQSNSGGTTAEQEDNAMRLKWDEANLYLNEGQMGGRMKITEPKTPFAGGYDPAEDEEELENINAQELAVDELDMNRAKSSSSAGASHRKNIDIPGLDLGEPEVDPSTARDSDSERRVHVDSDSMDVDGGHHGEESEHDMSREEIERHKKFEEMRKKHYEMKNVKNLLGSHPEDIEALDDDSK